jgi:hypothetical protein
LKRKRSQPQEYWVVNNNTTPRPAIQARGKERTLPEPQQIARDSSAGGNRGKLPRNFRGKDNEISIKNGRDELAEGKPRKRNRPSGTSAEPTIILGDASAAPQAGSKNIIEIMGSENIGPSSKQNVSGTRGRHISKARNPTQNKKHTQQSTGRGLSSTEAEIHETATSQPSSDAQNSGQAPAVKPHTGMDSSLILSVDSDVGKKLRRKAPSSRLSARTGDETGGIPVARPDSHAEVAISNVEQQEEPEVGKRTRSYSTLHPPTQNSLERGKKGISHSQPRTDVEIKTSSSKVVKGKGDEKQDVSASKASRPSSVMKLPTNSQKVSSQGEVQKKTSKSQPQTKKGKGREDGKYMNSKSSK